MGYLDDIIAEAARVAQTGRMVRARPVPNVDDVLAEATKVVKTRERLRRRRAMHEHVREDLARQSQLLAFQTADEDAMDNCVLRDESVRGLPESDTTHRCRITEPGHQHHGPHGPTPCVYTALCYRCGKVLPGQNRRWCSNTCSTLWWSNHLWAEASFTRRKMDNHTCVRCGAKGGDIVAEGSCALCGETWPCEQYLRSGTATSFHKPIPVRVALEVNHKDPRVGRGYDKGCAHHLDGLETLCHPCHVIETNNQRRARAAAARVSKGQERLFDVDHPPKGIAL